uniref:Uncharacterized protein n=1 Tax=Cyanoderma ruficeps TaxID=181631 RepID=A0A8C3P313_9PASS
SAQGPWSNTEISFSPQPSVKPAGQGSSLLMASLHACGTVASLPSLLFNFPKCVCANTTGFLFQPDKKVLGIHVEHDTEATPCWHHDHAGSSWESSPG